jgi:hypothetical protein
MASTNDKPHETIFPSSSPVSANETSRARSIATRLTETEFGEVEAAAADAGKKVAEWLREAALTHARAGQEEQTDPILLAEIMGTRNLMLNLFARASQGPVTLKTYVRCRPIRTLLRSRRPKSSWRRGFAGTVSKARSSRNETLPHSICISVALRGDPGPCPMPPDLRSGHGSGGKSHRCSGIISPPIGTVLKVQSSLMHRPKSNGS